VEALKLSFRFSALALDCPVRNHLSLGNGILGSVSQKSTSNTDTKYVIRSRVNSQVKRSDLIIYLLLLQSVRLFRDTLLGWLWFEVV